MSKPKQQQKRQRNMETIDERRTLMYRTHLRLKDAGFRRIYLHVERGSEASKTSRPKARALQMGHRCGNRKQSFRLFGVGEGKSQPNRESDSAHSDSEPDEATEKSSPH